MKRNLSIRKKCPEKKHEIKIHKIVKLLHFTKKKKIHFAVKSEPLTITYYIVSFV